MAFQKVDISVDARGRVQKPDQKIARIIQMFQSGLVQPEIAREAIKKISSGVYLEEIETVKLQATPLDSVAQDDGVRKHNQELKRADENAEIEIVKAQGLSPRKRPTL